MFMWNVAGIAYVGFPTDMDKEVPIRIGPHWRCGLGDPDGHQY